ncbi:MAG: ParB/RepB/Spo0J family partition protein [Armatimonadetes bacterium]|nr:ParB/RepB/Spo0J family partition protein [Armatimonadota bacterium]
MRKASGRGIGQLLGPERDAVSREVGIDDITPNKRQPRRHFEPDALEELAESIRVHGILSPILVRPLSAGKFEIIAGERRWRSAKLAGLKNVPVTIRSVAGQESLELAIIENVQREDISAYEAAMAYKQLVDEFGLTQEDVAIRVGKTRTGISNTLRLLRLPERILLGLQDGLISEGHARALLALGSEQKQLAVFQQILKDGLSVRDVEKLSATQKEDKPKPTVTRVEKDVHTRQLESAISERLGLPSKINRKGDQGTVEITVFSDDDLQKILDIFGVEL